LRWLVLVLVLVLALALVLALVLVLVLVLVVPSPLLSLGVLGFSLGVSSLLFSSLRRIT
jgi:hypothetical protein